MTDEHDAVDSLSHERGCLAIYGSRDVGIDHDIARQYISQVDFKASQSAWSYFALVAMRQGC